LFAVGAVIASVGLIVTAGFKFHLHTMSTLLTLVLWGLGVVSLVFSHVRMLQVVTEADTHLPIAFSVRGFILLHLGEVVVLQPGQLYFALGFYAIFELVLAVWPEQISRLLTARA
jgi:hypothetical protein